MNESVSYRLNSASELELADHLRYCDASFMPPLSGRVEIENYARKIAANAIRFEAWKDDALLGLLAVYCNEFKCRTAYITSVSVLPAWGGRGIASLLMSQCIEHVTGLAAGRIELDVHSESIGAIRLYEKHGFLGKSLHGKTITMCLNLVRDTEKNETAA